MKKGQMFSLDFLLSLALLFLAFGLLFRGFETAAYAEADEQAFAELKMVAETAGNLLVANPTLNCTLRNMGLRLMNCVNVAPASPVFDTAKLRTALAIPEGFNFSVESGTTHIGGIPGSADFVEVHRTLVPYPNSIPKNEYNTNFRDQSSIEVRIKVWRQ